MPGREAEPDAIAAGEALRASPHLADIIFAARCGDLDDLKSHEADGRAELMFAGGEAAGNTALHMAAANGHDDVVSFLLGMLPDRSRLDVQNDHGNTALHWAALNGRASIVDKLIKAGANPRIKNSSGHTPIYEAQTGGHKDLIEYFLMNVDYTEGQGTSDEGEEDVEEELSKCQLPPPTDR